MDAARTTKPDSLISLNAEIAALQASRKTATCAAHLDMINDSLDAARVAKRAMVRCGRV